VFDEHVRLRSLVAHYFSGQFVGNVLPSTIGGDVLRVTRLTTEIGSGPTAFGSVALERLTGFIALPLICVLGFAVNPGLLGEGRSWIALLAAGLTVTALAVILVLAAHPRAAGRFAGGDGWRRFIEAVHVGVVRMRVEPRRAFLAYVPAVAMAQVLPISLSGLGVREGMLVLLLTPFGVSTNQAVGIGLLWYLVMLLVSLLGAPTFAAGGRRRHPTASAGTRP
jgi:uncharacterized membrane protein YbhN (UPF0104 family)